MIISCPACSSRFQYDDARFGRAPSKQFKCTACAVVFEFSNPLLTNGARPKSNGVPAPAPPPVARSFKRRHSSRTGSKGSPSLVFLTGPKTGMAIGLINPETSIGRDSGDIATLDPETSSRHAVVEVAEDGSVWLIDCGSRNGTFTEGNAIDGRTQLSDRQEFTCGNSGFMLVIG